VLRWSGTQRAARRNMAVAATRSAIRVGGGFDPQLGERATAVGQEQAEVFCGFARRHGARGGLRDGLGSHIMFPASRHHEGLIRLVYWNGVGGESRLERRHPTSRNWASICARFPPFAGCHGSFG